MATPNVDAIVAKFVADLEEVFRVQAHAIVQETLRDALGGASKRGRSPEIARPARRARPPSRAPQRKRIRRTIAQIEQAEQHLLDYIKKHPGQRSETIRAAVRIDKNQWVTTISRLLEKGRVKSRGEKRLTTYTAV